LDVIPYLALVIAVFACVIALAPRKTDSASRLRRLELDLIELADIVDHQSTSLKKLHARASTRAAREKQEFDPNDPMARLPGETGEQWKARMGRTLTGIRRN